MSKIFLPNDSEQQIGGGWTFRRNLIKGLKGKMDVIDNVREADIVLLTSSSMVRKETVADAVGLKKKIVLRVDNVPRNSRNRNTGTSRLRSYADAAAGIVYQSEWSRDYLSGFLGKDGRVIYNGVDTEFFNLFGEKYDFQGKPTYLYSRFNRDETKRWEQAWFDFQMIYRKNRDARLAIIGNFSAELIEYNFDFFNGERFTYLGVINDQNELAKIYRGCDYLLAVYYNDCYSNTYQEFIACGGELTDISMTGGTGELIKNGARDIKTMTEDYLKYFDELLQGSA